MTVRRPYDFRYYRALEDSGYCPAQDISRPVNWCVHCSIVLGAGSRSHVGRLWWTGRFSELVQIMLRLSLRVIVALIVVKQKNKGAASMSVIGLCTIHSDKSDAKMKMCFHYCIFALACDYVNSVLSRDFGRFQMPISTLAWQLFTYTEV